MDWSSFWAIVNENLGTILTSLFSLILSILSFVIAYFRTRTKKIKLECENAVVQKSLKDLDLSRYATKINGVEYKLSDLNYYRIGEEK